MHKCSRCENEATWKSINEIVSLDTPYLCDEHMQTESVTGKGEGNPCFKKINEMEKVRA